MVPVAFKRSDGALPLVKLVCHCNRNRPGASSKCAHTQQRANPNQHVKRTVNWPPTSRTQRKTEIHEDQRKAYSVNPSGGPDQLLPSLFWKRGSEAAMETSGIGVQNSDLFIKCLETKVSAMF
jgi:hypothetical protein